MTSLGDLRPVGMAERDVVLSRAGPEDAARCRDLWRGVGRGFWSEREDWNLCDWVARVSDVHVAFWIAHREGEEAGFFELDRCDDAVKIEGFGLMPEWRGRGCGGGLLSGAVRCAFEDGVARVWLHTATDDHPNALPNYLKRGFRIRHEMPLADPMP